MNIRVNIIFLRNGVMSEIILRYGSFLPRILHPSTFLVVPLCILVPSVHQTLDSFLSGEDLFYP